MYMKNNSLLVTIMVAVIIGAVGFFAGVQYQKSQSPSFSAAAGGRDTSIQGRGGRFQGRRGSKTNGNAANRGAIIGKIINSDNNSITVQLRDGSSKIAVLSNNTTYETTSKASQSDLKNGDTVAVIGTTNSDGSITANSVQINPGFGQTNRMMNGTPPAPAR